ncbi:hypothetical protein ACELLULO517_15680 [Acidisoma cellulosilytica]|uniref:Uncharacterized protein n=1 Tax=Acidisoma cellulosilyticum TaxID=2802395 RepID=A0A964E573_9PROT|nr:hypothetical protein [Acidisoma cellulosilyticum]MCB8881688.1 hypothetical protein [Acidisoma cellulosilyticum]
MRNVFIGVEVSSDLKMAAKIALCFEDGIRISYSIKPRKPVDISAVEGGRDAEDVALLVDALINHDDIQLVSEHPNADARLLKILLQASHLRMPKREIADIDEILRLECVSLYDLDLPEDEVDVEIRHVIARAKDNLRGTSDDTHGALAKAKRLSELLTETKRLVDERLS